MATQLEEAARVDAEEGSPSPEVKVTRSRECFLKAAGSPVEEHDSARANGSDSGLRAVMKKTDFFMFILEDTETGVNDRNKQIKSIKDRRLQIQFAVDGAFPYTNPDNATTRRTFQLPLDRPFAVRLPPRNRASPPPARS